MSPEQARGRTVDRRADIWAFGVVFYEMLSGSRPYTGDSSQETMASVLRDEPKWDKVPSQAQRLLKRCLEKDPTRRLSHIGDVMSLLDEAPSGQGPATAAPPAAAPANPAKTWLSPAVAAVVVVLAVAGVAIWAPWRSQTSGGQAVRFEVGPSEKMTYFSSAMAVSPDGRWIVFPARGEDGVVRFWLRSLDTVEARALPGTETIAITPPASWSWDSRYVVFAVRRKAQESRPSGRAAADAGRYPRWSTRRGLESRRRDRIRDRRWRAAAPGGGFRRRGGSRDRARQGRDAPPLAAIPARRPAFSLPASLGRSEQDGRLHRLDRCQAGRAKPETSAWRATGRRNMPPRRTGGLGTSSSCEGPR